METVIENFKQKFEYMIALDSDGTVLDAMNAKHNHCHGPAFIHEWGLDDKKEEIQKIWNRINLYQRTRGVNRFLAVQMILKELDGKYLDAGDIKPLEDWTNKTTKLSATMLKKEIEEHPAAILEKALRFSDDLNARIAALHPSDKPAFDGVKDALEDAVNKVDISIVSSSNMSAITEEWGYFDLLKYVSLITSLESGSKKECLARIIATGVDPKHILMVGDAMPDVEAAQANGVWFYPISIGNEKQSWNDLRTKYLPIFTSGRFGEVQQELLETFERNFDLA